MQSIYLLNILHLVSFLSVVAFSHAFCHVHNNTLSSRRILPLLPFVLFALPLHHFFTSLSVLIPCYSLNKKEAQSASWKHPHLPAASVLSSSRVLAIVWTSKATRAAAAL